MKHTDEQRDAAIESSQIGDVVATAIGSRYAAVNVVEGTGYDRLDANDPHLRAVLNDIASKLSSHFGRSIPTEPNALADYARKRIAELRWAYRNVIQVIDEDADGVTT